VLLFMIIAISVSSSFKKSPGRLSKTQNTWKFWKLQFIF